MQDKAVIEQSVEIIRKIDSTILNIGEAGNQREVNVEIKKGSLFIDGKNDQIVFEILSKYEYSELDTEFTNLGIKEMTTKSGNLFNVTLRADYSGKKNISYNERDEIFSLTKSSNAYNLLLKNIGDDSGGLTIINFKLN